MVPICCVCVCVRACVCMHVCACVRKRTSVAVHEIIRGSMSPLLFLLLMCFPPWQLTTLHWLVMFYYFCQSWSCACDIQNRTAKWESYLASVALGVERLYWRTLTYKTEQPSGRGIWQVWLNVLKGFTEGTAVSLREGLNRWVQLMGSCVHPGF